jgi:hypothetical protein
LRSSERGTPQDYQDQSRSLLSHNQRSSVKKISVEKDIYKQNLFRLRTGAALRLRIRESFVKFSNKEGTMRTKTAILSIADLKAENLPVLREAFQALPGVEKIDFSLERSVAVLDFDPSQSHVDDFLRAALKAGFQVL